MKILIILLNLLAGLLTYPVMIVCHDLYEMAFSSGYAELDRAQVIDRTKLKEAYPKEFDTDRRDIPRLYLRGVKSLRWFVFSPIMAGFFLNAFLLTVFWKTKTAEPVGSAKPTPPGTSAAEQPRVPGSGAG
jgi:hypothetical protein